MKTRSEYSRGDECLGNLRMDEWLAGELDQDAAAQATAHVSVCAHCAALRGRRLAERAAFLTEHPPCYPQQVAPRLPSAARGLRWAVPYAGALAAAAALLLLLRPQPDTSPSERSKGGAHVTFHIKHGDQVRRGRQQDTVWSGDRVQLAYTTDQMRYLSVFGLDGAEHAAVYFPAGLQSVAMAPAREQALPISIELDATPGTEQLFALFCDRVATLAPLREELARTGVLLPPTGCTLNRIQLVKGTR